MAAVLERMQDTTEPLGWSPLPRREPSAAPLLALAGLLCMGLAVALLAQTDSRPAPADVVVASGVYAPGQDSGWHLHPGVHSVAVVAGGLTFYDEDCRAITYGAGEAYVGGDRVHLVRNETAEPAVFVVTHVRAGSTTTQAPPCALT